MSTNSELIFLAEVKGKMSKEKTLEENIRISMEEANGHWLISQYNDERLQFQAAMLAVSSFYGIDSPEFERISIEMKMVNALFFTPSNVPIDYYQLLESLPKDHQKIGIIEIWKDVRK